MKIIRSVKDNLIYSTKYIFSLNHIRKYKRYIIYSVVIYCSIYIPIIGEYIYKILYWIILGVISSIGIGTGLNTSILFVIPYTIKNIDNIRECLIIGYLWGIGSAIGEIPPYMLAKYRGEEYKKITIENKYECINKCNKIMVKILERYGMIGIIFFASYPNMFFDLCGIICGIYQYSFYKFFIPTVIGKSLIRISIQTYIIKYNREMIENIIINNNNIGGIFTYIFYIMIGIFMINIINITADKYKIINNIN